jgi:hypothetical protein
MTDDIDEDAWLAERRKEVARYLANERLEHGCIALEAAWCVAPYVSLWQIESLKSPRRIGWWAICGDHPTDYISANDLDEPREVLRANGERWRKLARSCGEEFPTQPSRSVREPMPRSSASFYAREPSYSSSGPTMTACGKMPANNALERTVGHSGPRLSAARSSWPAAQLGR